ncbi:hypothetical protein [Sansalvadorimonas verongulae]|uniref:hypothetical protein n=1 Tax=Sansalvadorimonas verongulae TaxID=2172824 RepID=UPI0012BD2030|nr:hypothetical protein [Sansalvadorimonas verongulae]MTI14563.1 hypothetical protein [Sansalvadorimonas verongulae]
MNATSRYLNQRQLCTINRIGNLFVPAGNNFPSFSESGCLYNIDDVLALTPEWDRQSLKRVLSILSICPNAALSWLLKTLQSADSMPTWSDVLTSQLRLLLFGLRGMIFTLYYSGQGNPYQPNRVYEAMDYHVSCTPDNPVNKEEQGV